MVNQWVSSTYSLVFVHTEDSADSGLPSVSEQDTVKNRSDVYPFPVNSGDLE